VKTQIKFYLLLLFGGLFLVLLPYIYSGNKQYKVELKNYDNFIESSLKLVNLQHKWRNKKEDKKLIKQIQSKLKPNFYKVKGNLYILDFDNLPQSTFSRLGKMLLNSDLIIKALDLKKDNKRVSLHVEIQI